MLYPKEDKENRILLYAVSASQPGAPVFRDRPTGSQRGPALLPVPPRPGLPSQLSP